MLTSPKYAGEPSAEALASGLATLGRYGDEYMVHAAEGETMIPAEVFEANPGLRDALFWQMQMMGIKDPNRFVVGNAMNSINPITGQPEFWFKKIFKKIKKVFKQALPMIAPIVGNLIAPGIGGLIASGLVTKLSGGSWGDVLKGAAIGWGTQGLVGGITGGLSGTSLGNTLGIAEGGPGFWGGLKQGLLSPLQAGSNLFSSGAANPLSQGILGTAGAANTAGASRFSKLFRQYDPNAQDLSSISGEDFSGYIDDTVSPETAKVAGSFEKAGDFRGGIENVRPRAPALSQIEAPLYDTSAGPPTTDQSWRLASFGDEDTLLGGSPESIKLNASDYKVGQVVNDAGVIDGVNEDGSYWKITSGKSMGDPNDSVRVKPDLIKRSVGSVISSATGADPVTGQDWAYPALTAAGVGAYSLFSEDDIPPPNTSMHDDYDAWRDIEDKDSPEAIALFRKWWGQPIAKRSVFEARIGGPSTNPDWWFIPEDDAAQTAVPDVSRQQAVPDVSGQQAGLGSILPQRAQPIQLTANRGGEVMGAGTGTSDSIPARLSDGEFVMTANAVRNAGNGDRNLGAARMYDMMRRFEGRAA